MPIIHSDFGDVDLTVVTDGVITHVGTEIASFIGMDQNIADSKTLTFEGGATVTISCTGSGYTGNTSFYKPDNTRIYSSSYSNGSRYHKFYVLCDSLTAYVKPVGGWDYLETGQAQTVGTDYTYASVFPAGARTIYGNPVLIGGNLSTTVPKTITANGTYYAYTDNADGYNPVVVNVSDGGNVLETWDLTSATPLVGMTRGVTATASSGMTFDASGAVFDAANDYINFPWFNFANLPVEIEVDVAQMQLGSLTSHQRFIMIGSTGQGLIYRSTHVWGLYNGSWTMSSFTDGNLFDNSTVKVQIDASGKWHIYKNGSLLWEPNAVLWQTTNMRIGETNGQSILNSKISRVSLSWG